MEKWRSRELRWREVGWYVLSIVAVLGIASISVGFRLIESIQSPLSAETYVEIPAASEPSPAAVKSPGLTLRFAVAPVVSPQKTVQAYRELAHFLAEKLGREPILLQCLSYAQANELVRNRGCDVALVCTYAFVRGEREFGMQALAMPVTRGARTYRSFIIVRKTSADVSLLQLGGKRFASADLMSTSGWLFPATWLKNNGIDPEGFFGQHLITASHDQSVTAVASGYVDGAAVISLIYEQMLEQAPHLQDLLKVILVSPSFGMPPLVCHPKIDPTLRERLRHLLIHMDRDEQGSKVLAGLRFDRFVVPDPKDYDMVRKMVTTWESR